METQTDLPNTLLDLADDAWRHRMHTLFHLLPPPLTNTPAAKRTRDRAALATISALAPVNANEVELAAQCVLARAQAEELMRLVRVHADDSLLAAKLNAQYAVTARISLIAYNTLTREQRRRRKREENQHDADTDEWTRHIAASTMLRMLPPEDSTEPAPEPKPEPESHVAENETSMGPPANQLTGLHPAPPHAPNQDNPGNAWPNNAWPNNAWPDNAWPADITRPLPAQGALAPPTDPFG